jgi:hypothetical protein
MACEGAVPAARSACAAVAVFATEPEWGAWAALCLTERSSGLPHAALGRGGVEGLFSAAALSTRTPRSDTG